VNSTDRAELLLLGAGGHAAACVDVVELGSRFRVAGLIGTAEELGSVVLGYSVVATDDALAEWIQRVPNVLVAIGQIRSPAARIRVFETARAAGAVLPSIVSPLAYVSRSASIGAGTIVMHGAVINASARIGENCIVNSMALIEHGAVVESHCHVATRAVLNGGVTVGRGSFVGSGAVVRQDATIGAHCVIGMGQLVMRDVADGTLVTTSRAR
jgi:sugar O-acyltransferase (sialic acid O-acetyltransferase NeuD family)